MGHSVSAERDRAASSEMVRCAEEFRLARESIRRTVLLGVVSAVVVPLFGGVGSSGVLREVSNEFDDSNAVNEVNEVDDSNEVNEVNEVNDPPPCCCCCCCRLEGMATGDPTAKLCPGEAPITANTTAPALEVALEGRAILEELLLPAEDVDWTRATSLLVAANAKTSRICVWPLPISTRLTAYMHPSIFFRTLNTTPLDPEPNTPSSLKSAM